jgi:hypothetical protein
MRAINERGRITLDADHEYVWVVDTPDEVSSASHPADPIGIIQYHRKPNGWCGGYVYFDQTPNANHPSVVNTEGVWVVNSLEPLDLSPSLLCPTCGDHGYITAGRWEAA